jgi:hypothetical protein
MPTDLWDGRFAVLRSLLRAWSADPRPFRPRLSAFHSSAAAGPVLPVEEWGMSQESLRAVRLTAVQSTTARIRDSAADYADRKSRRGVESVRQAFVSFKKLNPSQLRRQSRQPDGGAELLDAVADHLLAIGRRLIASGFHSLVTALPDSSPAPNADYESMSRCVAFAKALLLHACDEAGSNPTVPGVSSHRAIQDLAGELSTVLNEPWFAHFPTVMAVAVPALLFDRADGSESRPQQTDADASMPAQPVNPATVTANGRPASEMSDQIETEQVVTSSGPQEEKRRTAKRSVSTEKKIAMAVTLLLNEPPLTVTQIAAEVGLARTSLYKSDHFCKAVERLRPRKSRGKQTGYRTRGFINDGNIEGVD